MAKNLHCPAALKVQVGRIRGLGGQEEVELERERDCKVEEGVRLRRPLMIRMIRGLK